MLCPQDIIMLYGKGFGIEVMFREMKQVICAFGYRFWSKRMLKLYRFKKKTDPEIIESVTSPQDQKRIKLAVKAIEGFMFCSIVATGLLQMTALRLSDTLELVNLRYLRTKRSIIPSEATIADFLRKNFIRLLLQHPFLPITQIITNLQTIPSDFSGVSDVA